MNPDHWQTPDGRCSLLCGDALDLAESTPDKSVDCVLIDPPYCAGAISEAQRTRAVGQGLRSANVQRFGWFTGDNMGTAGLIWLLRALAFEAVRFVKPTGSFLCFCDWRMASAVQPAIESAGLRFQGLVVWRKNGPGLGVGFRPQHELILHFTFGSPVYHDKSISNVIDAKRVGDDREHQTQKPVDLCEKLIRVTAPPDGVVWDCFAGSGSAGEAAMKLGRRFVGAERCSENVRKAKVRLLKAWQVSPCPPNSSGDDEELLESA